MTHRIIIAVFPFLLAGRLSAQVSVQALNIPISQDFNTLPASGSVTWADNSTLAGWYHARTGSGAMLSASDGSTASGGFYSFGSGAAADRALGSIGSGNAAVGGIYYGIRLANNTGAIITALNISYSGEQWRNSAAAAQTVSFSYRTGAGLVSLLTGTWTPVTGLDFTSPITGGSPSALDGNLAANRVLITSLISGLSIPPGQEILLRWHDPDHPGNDHGLGIDDLVITPYGVSGPTAVHFSLPSSSLPENAGAATIDVAISNPSPTDATSVDVAWIAGTATNGSDVQPAYVTRTLTFPANSSVCQSITVPIFDDSLFEANETAIFQLQNVSGGYLPVIDTPAEHTLTIIDDDVPPEPSVVVNEITNGSGALNTDEAVELIVAGDNLDLRGYSLADATGSGGYPSGIVTFSNDPLWNNVQAGTIILIGGTASVPAVDADPSDGLLMLRAPAAGGSNQYFTANGASFSLAGGSDAVAIRDKLGAHIHGLAYGSGNAATLPPNRHGWHSGSLATGQSLFFTRSGGSMSAQDFNVNAFTAMGTPTPANPNDSDGNRWFLRSARSRTIAGTKTLNGTFYWNVTVNGGSVSQTGPVNIGNDLVLNDGIWCAAFALSVKGAGNAQNGAGAGNCTVGDNNTAPALLQLFAGFGPVSGTANLASGDATVEYRGTGPQAVLPATYANLTFRSGGIAAQKTIGGGATVNGTLTIDNGAWVNMVPPLALQLGPSGFFQNQGRFLGSIQTTRNAGTVGVAETFGNIGLSLTPNAAPAPGITTVKMTCGSYLWVGNLPSILKHYTVTAGVGTGLSATLEFRYEEGDLNGQNENALALKFTDCGGAAWTSAGGTLNASSNTLTQDVAAVNGIWTAHANPPQGIIVASTDSMYFETEEFGPIPVPNTLAISNGNGGGSIIEWSANPSTSVSPTWLDLIPSPATGINGGSFFVRATRTDLPPNRYSGTITVIDPHAANSPKIIRVAYLVQKRREICVGRDTIVFKASDKLPNATMPIPVLNCGGTFGPGVISWNATAIPSTLLLLAPPAGVEGQPFVITADVQGRRPGNHYGLVTLSGINSVLGTPIWNSPLAIPVRVELEPLTNFSSTVGNLVAGSTYTIRNAYGQRVAMITLNAGTISSLTTRMFPYKLVPGPGRMKYVYRYYQFDAVSAHYNADVTLFYTRNELVPMNIQNALLLRGWRQYPAGGAWLSTASSSSPIDNSVTVTGITNLAGNWAMAAPWTPKEAAGSFLPSTLTLAQNVPNPVSSAFGGETRIEFTLPEKSRATLQIFDLLGNLVATLVDGEREAGSYTVTLDAGNLRSGVYIYRLSTPQAAVSRKLAVIR